MAHTDSSQNQINREFEERDARVEAKKLDFEYIDLASHPPQIDALREVSQEEAHKSSCIPFVLQGKDISLASPHPTTSEAQDLQKTLEKRGFTVQTFLCSKNSFVDALKGYESALVQKKEITKRKEFSEKPAFLQSEGGKTLAKEIKKLPAKRALGEIEIAALQHRASDIHLQPHENGATLRFRIDGILHNILEMSTDQAQKIITQIKYEAGMHSNVSNLPQDGHTELDANGTTFDLRISTLPTPFLESVVIRILDSRRGIKDFSDLGFSPHLHTLIEEALGEKEGLVLVTGPTGSGKTTTLYSMLAQLNTPEKKIVTLEDPIEYHIPGISQSQVDENKEYNFENGLKSILRHDPDILLVGEIRTLKTAKLASEAALTGHTVLSSLHTNSAVGALERLRNLGLEDFNIAPTLNAVFAQRLIRKVLPEASEQVPLPKSPKITKAIERIREVFPDLEIPRKIPGIKKGLPIESPGYEGRTVLCEGFLVTEDIKKLVVEGKTGIDLHNFLTKNTSFLTLFEDGLMKVFRGETTLEEVLRVTG